MLETVIGQFFLKLIHLFNILLGIQVSNHNASETTF
jgi:hypothetical protein